MATLKELIAQRHALELEIDRAQKKDRDDAIAKVRILGEFTLHGLSVQTSEFKSVDPK